MAYVRLLLEKEIPKVGNRPPDDCAGNADWKHIRSTLVRSTARCRPVVSNLPPG